MKIIGVVGKTGAGKDVFCNTVRKMYSSALCLRFSDPLTDALSVFFEEVKKEDQQWLASVLRDRFGEDILMKGITRRMEKAEEDVVILNGIRVIEELHFVKEKGGTVVYITADSKDRWRRLQTRGEKKDDESSYEKFLEKDSQRSEQQIEEIGAKADVIIDNSGTLEELKEKIKNERKIYCF